MKPKNVKGIYRFIIPAFAIFIIHIITPDFIKAQMPVTVASTKSAGSFGLVESGKASAIYFDADDATVVKIAADAFKKDIELVTGKSPILDSSTILKSAAIIIGTIGRNKLIDQLIKANKLNVVSIKNKWETFSIAVIEKPFANINRALVICGSDPRGTAYGVFELSKMIGISPYYWWADTNPKHLDEIFITKGQTVSNPPSVKYRGIFLNDEDWGLQPWAAKTFEPETGDIGPKTYAKIFELLLRLKANLIWPAMHPSTKAFYSYPGNKKVAADYAIIIGSSHAEPMLRNNVGEWDTKTMGAFNYLTNKEKVYNYWEERVKESSTNEAIYTLGMRGVHDSGIEGVKTPKEAVPLVERIFEDQRNMLAKYINKDVTTVPQAFTAYKEVLEIYDNNLKLPDDVTLVWPDDNYGYIQRLNNEKEKTRTGGSGVYYHASYWGRPHDYLWLSSTNPGLIREEMMKAYENKTDKIWVLNVGDLKPLEYNIQLFLDMAYNALPFKDSQYSKTHLSNWYAGLFGKDKADRISNIMWNYYQLAFERRPEFMGWSQTEPTTNTNYTSYNHFYYGDEAQQRIDSYDTLEKQVKYLRTQINKKDYNAFYELVYYPVVGASLMNKKFLYRDKSYLYAKQNRTSSLDYATMSKQAYEGIVKETEYYNNILASGKWKNIMSMKPRDLPVYQEPVIPDIKINKTGEWNVAPEGFVKADSSLNRSPQNLILPSFDKANNQQYFVDVFLSNDQSVNWLAFTNDNWINISQNSGSLTNEFGKKQERIWVSINWNKIQIDKKLEGTITFKGVGKEISVKVIADASSLPTNGYKGFIENNGYVSIYAKDLSCQSIKPSGKWELIEALGHAGGSLEAYQSKQVTDSINLSLIKQNSSCVEYDFYTLTSAGPVVNIFSLPTHPLNNNYSMRYGVSIDDGDVKVVDFKISGRSEEWKQNVLRNSAIKQIQFKALEKGQHTLKVFMIDPGVIIDKITIDLGGLKSAYGTIPETTVK